MKKAADMVKTMKCKLQEPLRGTDGISSLCAIWDKWEKDSKAKLQVREYGIMGPTHVLPAVA